MSYHNTIATLLIVFILAVTALGITSCIYDGDTRLLDIESYADGICESINKTKSTYEWEYDKELRTDMPKVVCKNKPMGIYNGYIQIDIE